MKHRDVRITCEPEALCGGLFGNVFFHVFQGLPYLYSRGIFPDWEIRSMHYGEPPEFLTLPGALDLAYTPPAAPTETISLDELRRRHAQILGNDWETLHRIWHAYFRVPQRVVDLADESMPAGRVLGIHYRGTDKQTADWDSNPISPEQFLTLIGEFLVDRAEFDCIFAASDERLFLDKLRSSVKLPVFSLGEVEFHLAPRQTTSREEKIDRAMLDCVLLSRCECVIQTSSALPSFAKIFRPDLEIYRCAASKPLWKMPYFPVAYIPVLPVRTPTSADILRSTMYADWTSEPSLERFQKSFAYTPRWRRNHAVFSVARELGVSFRAGKLFTGYR